MSGLVTGEQRDLQGLPKPFGEEWVLAVRKFLNTEVGVRVGVILNSYCLPGAQDSGGSLALSSASPVLATSHSVA